ncbi:hypothetical protein ACFL33_03090 [Pseudomonadota bacterium]
MNWHEKLEQKRTLLIWGIVTICVAMLAVTARRDPVSRDVFWHLQTGLDWINRGLSPWIDRYSFTFEGHSIGGQPVLFQAAIAWFVDKLGLELGLHAFKFICFMSALGLVLLFLRKLRSPVMLYLLVLPTLVVLIQLRAIARPELIAYSFSIIAVMLYHRAHGRITPQFLIPIVVLMWVWSNYHTSVLGYVIFFGFFIDAAVLQLRQKAGVSTWLKWLVWGMVVVGAGFLTRSYGHSVIGALRFAPEWKGMIQEYQSAALYQVVPPIYGMLIIALATMALAIWRRKYGYLIVSGILIFHSLQTSRLVTPSGIIVICFFASLLSEINLKETISALRKPIRTIMGGGILVIFSVSLAYAVYSARAIMDENRRSALSRPESLVEYMIDSGITGRILNELGVGGYLIYKLQPESKVYIDGRTNILYPLKHYMRFLRVRNDPAAMREEIEKYDINLAILDSDPRAFVATHDSGILKLDYVDYEFSLFVRDNPNFPASGALLAYPACFSEKQRPLLENEQMKAAFTMPGHSMLFPYLGVVLSYASQPDKSQFLIDLRNSPERESNILRFAAYQALINGLDQVSLDLFTQITEWDLGEYLAASIANIRQGQFENAEYLIDKATQFAWPNVTNGQVVLLYRVLRALQANSSTGLISAQYVEQQRSNLVQMGESTDELELDPRLLCNQVMD